MASSDFIVVIDQGGAGYPGPTPYVSGQEITYGFLSGVQASDYAGIDQASPSLLAVKNSGTFQAFDVQHRPFVQDALAAIQRTINLTFRPANPGEVPMIRFGFSDVAGYGGANFRTAATHPQLVNDIYLDPMYRSVAQLTPGNPGYSVLLHEIGHALGLKHPFDMQNGDPGTVLEGDNSATTVMSYTDSQFPGTILARTVSPLLLDVGALQELYGARSDPSHSGSTTYVFNPGTRTTPGVSQAEAFADEVRTIWDSGGNADVFDASLYGTDLTIDLGAGQFSSIGGVANVTIAYEALIENARGGAGEDILKGNFTGNELWGNRGGDILFGLDGEDRLFGGGQADTLNGGAGADRYYFTGEFAEGGLTGDVILDDGQTDRIVLDAQVVNGQLQGGIELNETFRRGMVVPGLFVSESDPTRRIRFTGPGFDQPSDLILEHAGGEITIRNWTQGEFGITLSNDQARTELGLAGSTNAWRDDPEHLPAQGVVAQLSELGGELLKLFANREAKEGDAILLQLSGAGELADYAVVTGDQQISFAAGQVQLNLFEGQTESAFAFVSTGDVDSDETLTLTATFVEANPEVGSAPVAHGITIAVDGRDEPQSGAPQTTRDIIGDLEPVDFDPGQPGTQTQLDDLGNVIVGTTAAPNRVDTLNDSTGNDNIVAGGGNDTVNALGGGDDLIDGGAGDDQLNAGPGHDLVRGGTGRDVIRGDVFGGAAGNDLLEGGDDGDLVYGMSGDDRIYGGVEIALQDAIAQGAAGAGSALNGDFLQGLDGADIVVGLDRKDLVSGGEGDDVLVGAQGDDFISGDAFYDAFTPDWNVTVTVVDNTTTFTVSGATLVSDTSGADTIHAGGGNDGVLAGAGDDLVFGEEGDDRAWGDAGNDALLGGAGNDLLNGDNGENLLATALHGSDFLDGGDGNDELFGMGASDVLLGGAGDDELFGDSSHENAGDDYLDGEDGSDVLVGAGGGDTLLGGAGDDQLHGDSSDTPQELQGDDTIYGEAGFDLLQGYDGDDYLDGGADDDTLFGQEGEDILFGGDGLDTLVGDNATFDEQGGDDYLDGEAGDDLVLGEAGNDVLIGGAGLDQLAGGFGDDELYGDEDADILQGDLGSDYLDGGDGDDQLVGDDTTLSPSGGDDVLFGGAGMDTLFGESGADTLDGGDDDDQLFAGDGDDRLDGGAGNDLLLGETGDDTLLGGEGDDQLQGSFGDDVLDGGAGADTLFGEFGNDTLLGGEGNDAYVVGMGQGIDHIADSGGEQDVVFFTDALLGNIRLDVGSLRIVFSAGGELHLDDFDAADPLAGSIEFFGFADGSFVSRQQLIQMLGFQVRGTPGDDTLSGTGLGETIQAFAGNDWVSAGGGNDQVLASDGDDIVFGDGGDDTLLDGGAGNDYLFGGEGADRLVGGEGADVLSGDAGNDTLEGGIGNDLYFFGRGGGQDTANDSLGVNSVQLTDGLTDAQVRFSRAGNDLRIEVLGTTDRLTVTNWFGTPGAWDSVALGDGTRLDRAAVAARLTLNQAPVLAPDSASTFEDNFTAVTGNALANDLDPEGRALSVTTTGTRSGTYGSLTLQSSGAFSYSVNNALTSVQSLALGQTASDTFTYTATDNDPNGAATASSTITVNIAGRNDAPAAQMDFAFVQEDGSTDTFGNVLLNDTDVDAGAALSVAAPGTYQGTYGTLTLSGSGSFTYLLNNDSAAVQSLAAFTEAVDNFAYATSDGMAQSMPSQLQVIVIGNNDAPVVSTPLADQTATAGRSFSYAVPQGSFTDVDSGDVLTYSAALVDGFELPAWLAFNAATQTFTGTAPSDATGFIDVQVTADDGHRGEEEVGGSSASDVFRITFATRGGGGGGGGGGGQGNEGVGNGEDPPPPGHDHSFNDGPGTSPGNPGAQGGNGYVPLEPRTTPTPHALTGFALAVQTVTTHGNAGGHGAPEHRGRRAANQPDPELVLHEPLPADVPQQGLDTLALNDESAPAPLPAGHPFELWLSGETPHFDFEALLQALAARSEQFQLSPEELARRWGLLRQAAEAAGIDANDGWTATERRLLGGLLSAGWGFEASVGAGRGAQALRTLEGLSEGFERL